MAPVDGLHYLGIAEVAEQLRAGSLSSREVTEHLLSRISNSALNAFITVTESLALQQADKADAERAAGKAASILHGVPIALKDIFDLSGVATTGGMPLRRGSVAKTTATAVQRLIDSGAVIVGKLNLAEGIYAEHAREFGAPLNVWNKERYAGASSSGSAVAVAAGLCYAAPSSDTGGSIRLPSGANGVTGIKPTWGRISRYGVLPLAPTLDHVGVIARSAADAGCVLGAMAGADSKDPTASKRPVADFGTAGFLDNLTGVRIGLDEAWVTREVDAQVTAVLANAIEVLVTKGATVHAVTFPDPEQIIMDWFEICGVQAAAANQDIFPSRSNEIGDAFRSVLELGHAVTAIAYHERELRRLEFTARVQSLFDDVDFIAVPVYACLVPTLERMKGIDGTLISMLHRFTCSFTMAGNPTITLPGGFATDGTPIAFQLVGQHFAERGLVEAGYLFQQETDWHRRRPPIDA